MTEHATPRPAYRLEMPETQAGPVIVASPHSGRHYPWGFARSTVLDERTIRSSEDAFVDLLVAEAPALGAPFLAAEYPRAYIDLNRSCDELDPAVIEDMARAPSNPRVSSGLGVIPRVVANGRLIYRGKLRLREAEHRIEHVWRPYHTCLDGVMQTTRANFGTAILLDFHSMPGDALDAVARPPGAPRPDVVIGDRFGASASADVVDALEAAFHGTGLVVSRNTPFAGAYIAQHYGRPSRDRHAVQIEIDRRIYMNEALIRPNGNFRHVKALLTGVLGRMIGDFGGAMPVAAE
jgi:N-formylglutamate amidohydrolase